MAQKVVMELVNRKSVKEGMFYLELNEELAAVLFTDHYLSTDEVPENKVQDIAREAIKNMKKDGIMIEPLDKFLGCDLGKDNTGTTLVTNSAMIRGAACILLQDVIDYLRTIYKGGCYILPSSKDEVLVVPKDKDLLDYYREMVHDINQQMLRPEERLSDEVFEYSGYRLEIAKKFFP